MTTKLWLAAGCLAGTMACAGADDVEWAGTVRDSAGIAIVENPAVGLWSPEGTWRVVEELRIGSAEGDAEYLFGQLLPAGSVAIASDGRIVVLDAQGQHLKVFTAAGRYERTIGRPGGGPGEIGPAQQSAVLLIPGDTLVVNDFGNQRVNIYLLDGTFVRSFPVALAQGLPVRWEVGTGGRIVVQIRSIAFPGSTTVPDSMDAIVVRHLDGSFGDTLMRMPTGLTFQITGGAPEWNFFVPEPLWTFAGDHLLTAVNNDYRIRIHAPDGTLQTVITKPFTLTPVTEADEATMREGFKKLLADQGAPPQIVNQLAETRLHFAPTYPAFAQVVGGPGGTILVQLFQPVASLSAEEQEGFDFMSGSLGSRVWDVFDAEGRYLGIVEMPVGFQPVLVRGTTLYGIQRDELDVQYVVVARIDNYDGPAMDDRSRQVPMGSE